VKAAAGRFWASVAGLSPETVALILAVGLVLGVFPVYGGPTVLCGLAAVVLRVNLPALQLVNQLVTPIQFALLIPFGRLGACILGGQVGWSLLGVARDAVVGWFCICVPLGVFLYFLLVVTLRRCPQGWFNGLESSG